MSSEKESNDIDLVRQLILGNQVKKFDTRFSEIEQSIVDLKNQLRESSQSLDLFLKKTKDNNNEMNKNLKESIKEAAADLSTAFENKFKVIEKELKNVNSQKADRNELGDILMELANKLRNNSK